MSMPVRTSLRDEIGDFVGIPNSFIEDEQQTAESRVVFMILRYHVHRKKRRAFPGYETIMRETGLSRQKTAAGLNTLEKTGWLVKHHRFASTTEYELCYPSATYSSTMELQEDAAIVPLRNDYSSTVELTPLINTKTDITRLPAASELPPVSSVTAHVLKRARASTNGHRKPRPPEKSFLSKEFTLAANSATIAFVRERCPDVPVRDAFTLWMDSRISDAKESADWEADFRKYCLTWQANLNEKQKRYAQR